MVRPCEGVMMHTVPMGVLSHFQSAANLAQPQFICSFYSDHPQLTVNVNPVVSGLYRHSR